MKRVKRIYGLLVIAFSLIGFSGKAQTSNPATTKPNQTTPAATSPTTDPAVDKNTQNNQKSGTTTRTDSVVQTPKEGTSITTAPGTRNKKPESKISTRKKSPKK